MPDYPADSEFVYKPSFADSLEVGDVIASDRDGNERMEIIREPVYQRNPLTRSRYIIHRVRLVGTDEELDLIFAASSTVYTRRFFHSPSHPEMTTEL